MLGMAMPTLVPSMAAIMPAGTTARAIHHL